MNRPTDLPPARTGDAELVNRIRTAMMAVRYVLLRRSSVNQVTIKGLEDAGRDLIEQADRLEKLRAVVAVYEAHLEDEADKAGVSPAELCPCIEEIDAIWSRPL